MSAKSLIKNIAIAVLFIGCIYLLYILWFEQVRVNANPQQITANTSPHIFKPMLYIPEHSIYIAPNSELWEQIKPILAENISSGLYSFAEFDNSIRLQYAFALDFGSFLSELGLAGHHIPSPQYFGHIYTTNNFDFLEEYINFQLASPALNRVNFIGEFWLSTIQPFVNFFFPNPNSIATSIINGIYTYHDNYRVVRFYPDYFVEYNTTIDRFAATDADLISSLSRAFELIERDRLAMQSLDAFMNDVFLVKYEFDSNTQVFSFFFDYAVRGMPVMSDTVGSARYLSGLRDFAIEIQVLNNTVISYRRFMVNLLEEEQESPTEEEEEVEEISLQEQLTALQYPWNMQSISFLPEIAAQRRQPWEPQHTLEEWEEIYLQALGNFTAQFDYVHPFTQWHLWDWGSFANILVFWANEVLYDVSFVYLTNTQEPNHTTLHTTETIFEIEQLLPGEAIVLDVLFNSIHFPEGGIIFTDSSGNERRMFFHSYSTWIADMVFPLFGELANPHFNLMPFDERNPDWDYLTWE